MQRFAFSDVKSCFSVVCHWAALRHHIQSKRRHGGPHRRVLHHQEEKISPERKTRLLASPDWNERLEQTCGCIAMKSQEGFVDKIRIAIGDDHALVLEGMLLLSEGAFEIVGKAHSGQELLEISERI